MSAQSHDDLRPQNREILEILDDEPAVKPSMIADELDIYRQNAYRSLTELVRLGIVKKNDHGMYYIDD